MASTDARYQYLFYFNNLVCIIIWFANYDSMAYNLNAIWITTITIYFKYVFPNPESNGKYNKEQCTYSASSEK